MKFETKKQYETYAEEKAEENVRSMKIINQSELFFLRHS